jgi:chromate transport protein ChrA
MIIVQGIVMVAIFSLALQRMDPEDRWGWMATALVLFIAMNRVINVYFYLIVLLLLVMHGISVSTLKEKPDEEEEAPN